ncbi:hypothetical protein OCAE111667_15460 [Occultella aeris]|uniref:Uncharacterized protein n=1 Tax=Occultella aeris TaxID=2761496 RepID=A0A7M4DRH6_9MICO|nr:hypothetical protein [Occultella aeris]VZO40070.1 hypothetical protein HALOF300_04771 [Occultella aeris]
MSDLAEARAAKERLAAELGDRVGVIGVGLERVPDGYCVRVNVRDEATGEQVPATVDGVEVRVAVVGTIRIEG